MSLIAWARMPQCLTLLSLPESRAANIIRHSLANLVRASSVDLGPRLYSTPQQASSSALQLPGSQLSKSRVIQLFSFFHNMRNRMYANRYVELKG